MKHLTPLLVVKAILNSLINEYCVISAPRCVLEKSEKIKRKGSAADKWNRRKPKKPKLTSSKSSVSTLSSSHGQQTLNDLEAQSSKPETFAFQWTDQEVDLLKRNIENCANFHKCTPEEIIHGWNRSERGDFYRIVATGRD